MHKFISAPLVISVLASTASFGETGAAGTANDQRVQKPQVQQGMAMTKQSQDLVTFLEINRDQVFAEATLVPKSGTNATGTVIFLNTPTGLNTIASVQNTTPGMHGIHIHETGDCSAPDASSAGDHFNPAGHPHGYPNPSEHHLGDLGNIIVQANGQGMMSLNFGESMKDGINNWNDLIGKAVVLHSTRDDLQTQPSGDSGDRIACGVIEAVETKTAH